MLTSELDDEYLQVVEGHLKALGFRRGTLISAGLGRGNKGLNYVLRKAREQGWRDRIPVGNRQGYSFSIPDRDDNGYRASPTCGPAGSTAPPTRSPSPTTTSWPSSRCSAPSRRSTSAA